MLIYRQPVIWIICFVLRQSNFKQANDNDYKNAAAAANADDITSYFVSWYRFKKTCILLIFSNPHR